MAASRKNKGRIWLWTFAVLLLLLVGLRLALPHWVIRYVNDSLADMGDYSGHVEDVDLYLWRGAYAVKDLRIDKNTSEFPVPLLNAPTLELTISWRALLNGEIVAAANFYSPELNFVDGKAQENQAGMGVNWREELEALAPFRLDTVEVHDGTVWFRNYGSEPVVDIHADEVEAVARNLTNVGEKNERAASYELTARLPGGAPFESRGTFDPFNADEDFSIKLRVTGFDLVRLNEFLRAYANLDVKAGVGDFVMELEARNGQLDGYAKPLFRDVDIFSWQQDVERQGDNPLRLAWEAISEFVENLFQNQAEDQFATRVEISGTIENSETGTLGAIAATLRNAFVEAFKPQFENLPQAEQSEGE